MADILTDRVIAAIGDVYSIEGELGRGGMAIVYRAKDLRLRRTVALKVLPPELAFREEVRTRFLREAEMSAQLSHPNIVPIYSVDERGGIVYFAMGLVEGETLGQMLDRDPRPPVARVRQVLAEVAEALAYAHKRGVVHRDVKPDNILVERETGRAIVTDFGIARAAEEGSRLTVTGVAVGTPAYMSPEQALGERELDGRSDVYSLGVVGYQMLAGELPFRAGNTAAMLMKHVSENPRPVRERRLDCPPALARAIEVAMAKQPESRWHDASAFRDALNDERVAAPPPPAPAEQPRPSQGSARIGIAAGPLGNFGVEVKPFHNVGLPPLPPFPSYRDGPDARQQWKEARRVWRDQVREQQERWKEERRELRREGRGGISRYRSMSLEDRIISFRSDALKGLATTLFLCFINVTFTPFFPWAVFPAVGMISRLYRKWETIGSEGVSFRDAISGSWRKRLAGKGKLLEIPSTVPQRQDGSAAAKLASSIARDVLDGPYGPQVRRAIDDRVVIAETAARLSEPDRQQVPDLEPTATSLYERVVELATSLTRVDADVRDEALAQLDNRLVAARREAPSKERDRRVQLLERQLATLLDLKQRRELLVTQFESATLVLQNLRLDVLKLRSSGVDAAMSDLNSATQEARALSREIGHVLAAADEVRKL